jgi:WD40 repeat protein
MQIIDVYLYFRNYGLTIEDEFQLDDGIISGSFDNSFDMGIVGTLCGSLWYICWITDRSKTRLNTSHTDEITGLISIEDTHIVTSSLDGTIRIFQLEDRNEILRFNADGLVRLKLSYLISHFYSLESHLSNLMGQFSSSDNRFISFNKSYKKYSINYSINYCRI